MSRVGLLFGTLGKSTYATLQRSSPTRGKISDPRTSACFLPFLLLPGPRLAGRLVSALLRTHTTPLRGLPTRPFLSIGSSTEKDSIADQSGRSLATSTLNNSQMALSDVTPPVQRDGPTRSAFSFASPRPTRRATVLGRSPEKSRSLDVDVDMTSSKRREKSKSANDLKRLIHPITKVQLELDDRERSL